jgi:hypothetical protein
MSPSAMDIDPPTTEAPLAPPKTYPAREAYFEEFIQPRPDGYQKAISRGVDNAAIVIDNGIYASTSTTPTMTDRCDRFFLFSCRMVF